MDRIIQLLVNAAALYVAVQLVSGLDFAFDGSAGWVRFLVVAFIFGLVNTFVRPVLRVLTLPITLLTLGLFLLVINALMLLLTGAISSLLDLGFVVDGFGAALLGSIIVSLVGFALSAAVGASRRLA